MSPMQDWNSSDRADSQNVERSNQSNLNFANLVTDGTSFANLGQSTNSSAEAHLPNLSITGLGTSTEAATEQQSPFQQLEAKTATAFRQIINDMSQVANGFQALDASLGSSSGGSQSSEDSAFANVQRFLNENGIGGNGSNGQGGFHGGCDSPQMTTSDNTTTPPVNTTSDNTTTPPATTTSDNTTIPPTTTTSDNTTIPPTTTTSDNTTIPPATTTSDNTSTPPANTTSDNTTTPPANTTSDNTTTPPATTTSDNTTTPPATTTSDSTTTPPATTTSDNTTTPLATTTSDNTTIPPGNSTTDNTTNPPAGTLASSNATAPPAAAAAAGFNTETFSGTQLGTDFQPFDWLGVDPNSIQATQNSDGSMTVADSGDNYGAQLMSTKDFSNGMYVQATLSTPGPTTGAAGFWANSITDEQHPQSNIEVDFMEMDNPNPNTYGVALHDWGTPSGPNTPDNVSGGTVTMPAGDSLNGTNTYGFLWKPATANSQGEAEWFLNGQQVGPTYNWNQGSQGLGLLDSQAEQIIFGSGDPASPVTVNDVQVWQTSNADASPIPSPQVTS